MKKIKFILLTLILFSKAVFSQTPYNLSANPNPFIDTLNIKFTLTSNDTVSLDLFNMLGENVNSILKDSTMLKDSYSLHINADSLPVGIYVLKLTTKDSSSAKKIVKQNGTINGIKNIGVKTSEVLLSPNPVSNLLNIPEDGIKNLIITDITGRKVRAITMDAQFISTEGMHSGIYLVSVYSKDNKLLISQKICKQ